MYMSAVDFQVAIVDAKADVLAGTIGLHQIDQLNGNADISILVGNRDFWGKRLGKEAVSLIVGHAFRKLNLRKVTAGMVEDNVASLRLFEQLDFKREALLREHTFFEGRYRDQIRLGLLRTEWTPSP
jgi:RimJ/RimL family protein N-acetyltransferase